MLVTLFLCLLSDKLPNFILLIPYKTFVVTQQGLLNKQTSLFHIRLLNIHEPEDIVFDYKRQRHYTKGKRIIIRYKIDIMETLKIKEYNSYKLRQDKIFVEATMTKFRKREYINFDNLNILYELL